MVSDLHTEMALSAVLSSPHGGDPVIVVHGQDTGIQGHLEGSERNRYRIITLDGRRISVPRPMVVVDTTVISPEELSRRVEEMMDVVTPY